MAMMRKFLAGGVVLALACPAWAGGPIEITDAKDKQIVESFLKHVDTVPQEITADACKKMAADEPEGFTWEINPFAAMPLTAYEMTGDVKYLEHVRAGLRRDALGADERARAATWTGTASRCRFSRTRPRPDLKVPVMITGYSDQRDHRAFRGARAGGSGPEGASSATKPRSISIWPSTSSSASGRPAAISWTSARPARSSGPNSELLAEKASLTQPHNKHSIIINGYLQLYRVTGNDDYMKKAILLGTRYKHCLHLNDGHYEWHYWDPAGAWDVKAGSANEWKHWIGVEHTGGYYSSTLSQAVRLYEFGVVFDKTDLERFVKTQVAECWNGSMDNPQWARVDGTRSEQYMQGEYMCPALAAFNDKVAEFCYGPRGQSERLKGLEHNWQGGPVARGWIAGKYIELPRMKGGVQADIEFGQKFLSKAENQEWYNALAFTVEPPGYIAPQTPSEMKNMPK